jgi:hypothetical protein
MLNKTNVPLETKPRLQRCCCRRRAQHKVFCAQHKVFCALHKVFCAQHKVFCALHKVFCALHKVFCALHKVFCALHKVFCAQHKVFCAHSNRSIVAVLFVRTSTVFLSTGLVVKVKLRERERELVYILAGTCMQNVAFDIHSTRSASLNAW